MLDLTPIDRFIDDGSGERELTALMRQSGLGQEALFRIRWRTTGLNRSELQDIVELWRTRRCASVSATCGSCRSF
jgi:hypothetical protein